MPTPVADLHCDLLLYLQSGYERTPYDAEARCAIPQLRAGHVKLQVLPIFTETENGSSMKGLEQAEVFKVLANQHPEDFEHVQICDRISQTVESEKIAVIAAFENASAFCEESEEITAGLERLILLFGKVGRPIYISLTWNQENRFGGGAHSSAGLKDDGRRLLDFLHGKRIAVDLSHASDNLAHDLLFYLQEQKLHIPVLASHSNMRSVCDVPRNLPNELLQEIVARNGIIGLNLVRSFVGKEEQAATDALQAQLQAALSLVSDAHLALGADFFYEKDLPKDSVSRDPRGGFYPEFCSAECYPKLLHLWQEGLGLSQDSIERIAYQNVLSFIRYLWEGELSPASAPLVQL